MNLESPLAERSEGVVRLRLSGDLLEYAEAAALQRTLDVLVEDRELASVVLTGSGDSSLPGPTPALVRDAASLDPAASLARIRIPVIAVLRGDVRSMGTELALAADVRVAHPSATLRLSDVREGRLPCWGGTQRLPRTVGRSLATEMLLLGRVLNATDAASVGAVHVVDEKPDNKAMTLAEEFASASPLALAYAKEAILLGSEMPLRDGLRLESDLNALLQTSDDRAEGLAAFFDKRDPEFHGR